MKLNPLLIGLILIINTSCSLWANDQIFETDAIIVDHNCTKITDVPVQYIESAKEKLIIAYGHTSHGSQLTYGMGELDAFMHRNGSPEGLYKYNNEGSDGALALRDMPFEDAYDLGNPDFTSWASATRKYLEKSATVNVIMWSWCGQVGWASNSDIDYYLQLMTALETDFPTVKFVYMTGHLDGSGVDGTTNQNNNKIRNYCNQYKKILFDFADIESFDPDGKVNYMELKANDNCDYDSDNDGNLDKNWATAWQESHVQDKDWYYCDAAHSQPLNGNRKAYAAWHLFARLAGWQASNTGNKELSEIGNPQKLECTINNGVCTLKCSQKEKVSTVRFYSLSGQVIHSEKINRELQQSEDISVNLTKFAPALLNKFLIVQLNGNKNSLSTKIYFK